MNKILKSLMTLGLVATVAVFATSAYFNDTETSSANVFQAGAVDLKIDSQRHYNGMVCVNNVWEAEPGYDDSSPSQYPVAGESCEGTFAWTDLNEEKFFEFGDVKPGDWGENTISLHVFNNPAHACMYVENMVDYENGQTEPEAKVDGTAGTTEGELSTQLRFFAWDDLNGNNVWDNGEKPFFSNLEGPASDVLDGQVYRLPYVLPGIEQGDEASAYIGLYWCYGDITVGDYMSGDYSLSCSGAAVDNTTQTDVMSADLRFYVEQSRHNDEFECPALPSKVVTTTGDGWSPVDLDDLGGGHGKEWFAKSRNNNGGFEVAVGTTDAVRDDANTTWVAGATNSFTLTYDGAGNATYTSGGQTVTYSVGLGTYGRIGVNVKAPTGVTTTVSDLTLSEGTLGTNTVNVTGGTNNLTISGVDLSGGFTLTGNFVFSAVGSAYSDENPAMQISID